MTLERWREGFNGIGRRSLGGAQHGHRTEVAMKVAGNLFETIGNTPLLRLNRVTAGTKAEILGKLEFFSPSGSLKDRILYRMIAKAEERGELKPGMTILEGTTGNTGISTAMAAAVRGYKCIIVMPGGMSEERKKIIRAYGAELVETPGGESDVDLTLKKVAEILARNKGKMWEVRQFSNLDNNEAHYLTTGPEIWDQTDGRVDALVATQGTGGTISGAGKFLREKNQKVKLYAVEPAECPILSEGRWGPHKIEGIGDGFVPDCLDVDILDGIVKIPSDEAIEMAQRLAREEGLFCGISSGCNVVASLRVAKAHPELKTIVTMINDSGQRYFSTELCGETAGDWIHASQDRVVPVDTSRIKGKQYEILA
jgi:cysteine synthase A